MLIGKKKREPQPTPPWLTWGVIIFIAAALLLNVLGIKPQMPGVPGGQPGNLAWNIPSVDTYKSRLIPGYGRLQIAEIKTGTGLQALCGQEVYIRWRESEAKPGKVSAEDVALKDMKEDHFQLGDTKVAEALRSSVIGMHVGGVRSVLVPAERTESRAQALRYLVELTDVKPQITILPAGKRMPLQVFDRRPGNMAEVTCGDKVKMHLTIWDLEGTPLLNTREVEGKPLEVALGQSPLMVGIEMGILGMQADAARTLIIPAYLAQPLHPFYGPWPKDSPIQKQSTLDSLALPPNQTILVDVDLVP